MLKFRLNIGRGWQDKQNSIIIYADICEQRRSLLDSTPVGPGRKAWKEYQNRLFDFSPLLPIAARQSHGIIFISSTRL